MEVRAAYAFVLALFLCMALIPLLVRTAGMLGFVDAGGERKVHAGAVPRNGGLAIFAGFLVSVLLWVPLRGDLADYLAAATVLVVFGALDDRLDLDYRLKFFGQVLAAAVVAFSGAAVIREVPPFLGGELPEPAAVALTVFVLVAVTNAVNLSDGLDGLAGGISLLAAAGLLVLGLGGGDPAVLVVLAALAGAVLGFLRFNTYPARLFMGDSGSQFLGFSCGVLAILVTQRANPALSPVLPLLLLGLPILDTLTVMVGRLARGQSPFHADRTHLHHRLLAAGFGQFEAVGLIYAAQFGLIVLAFLLRYSADVAILASYAVFSGLLLLAVRRLQRHWTPARPRQAYKGLRVRARGWQRRTQALRRVPFWVLSVSVPLFLVGGALMAPAVSVDVGVLGAALLAALLAVIAIAVWLRPIPVFPVERLCAYTAAVVAVYFFSQPEGLRELCPLCLPGVYGMFALSAILWARSAASEFQVSTLDLLILLGALAAPALQGLGLQALGVLVLQVVVVFYAVEILRQERTRHWDALRLGVISALAVLGVRGLWS